MFGTGRGGSRHIEAVMATSMINLLLSGLLFDLEGEALGSIGLPAAVP